MISRPEPVGDASAVDRVSAAAREAFDHSQAAHRPVGCLVLSVDYRALLASTHGEQWIRGVESEVLASLETLVGEGEAFLVPSSEYARLWVPGLGVEPLTVLAERILTAIRERSFLAPTGVQPITLSLGLACSDCVEPRFDPALCFETLESVAQEGLELAVDGGGDRFAHSELYGILQAGRARREPAAAAAQALRVRELVQQAEREAAERSAAERAAAERAAAQAPAQAAAPPSRVARAAALTHTDLVPWDATTPESGEALTRELRGLLDSLRDGRREPAAVESRIAELVQSRLAFERRRVGQEKDSAYGVQVDKLERRLTKLNDALERTEERLRGGFAAGVETGAASAFRSVQGLSLDEPEYELKRDLMEQIFQANLELARWTTVHGS